MTSYESRRFGQTARDAVLYGPDRPPRDWRELCIVEPRMRRIAEAVEAGRYGRFESDWPAIKLVFSAVVGWNARRAILGTSTVWEIAGRELRRLFERGRRRGARR